MACSSKAPSVSPISSTWWEPTIWIKRFYSMISQRYSRATLVADPKHNTLAGLPVELLLSIADFVCRDDIICFSLCNRRLFSIFYHRVELPFKAESISLLNRLERDCLNHFTCYICYVLHKYDGSLDFAPGTSSETTNRLRCSFQWNRTRPLRLKLKHLRLLDLGYIFTFLHLQLAMKRFYYGPQYGISTDALSYTEVKAYPRGLGHDQKTSLFSFDAQICHKSPSLIIRIQQIQYIQSHGRNTSYFNPNVSRRQQKMISADLQDLFICRHISKKDLSNLVNHIMDVYGTGKKSVLEIATACTYSCEECDTDFHIEALDYETDLALCITKWIDLGPGINPDDPQWKQHSDEIDLGTWKSPGQARIRSSNGEFGARMRFEQSLTFEDPQPLENGSQKSLKKLRSHNLYYLKNQRYKNFLVGRDSLDPDVCYLAKKPLPERPNPRPNSILWKIIADAN